VRKTNDPEKARRGREPLSCETTTTTIEDDENAFEK